MDSTWAALIRQRHLVAPPRPIAAAVMLALVLLSGRDAWAGTPADEVRGFLTRAVSIVEDAELAPRERLGAVRAMLTDFFDVRGAAELALGQYWRARTPAERREFVPLFGALLEQSYLSQVRSRIALDGPVKITYLPESVNGDHATVHTLLSREGREDVPFDYRMIRRGHRWAVRDIVIDGVSLVENYRAQFVKAIQDSSYRQLVSRMKARVSDLSATRAATAAPPAARPARGGFRLEPALKDVQFDADASTLSAAAAKMLDENVAWLKANGNGPILIEGYTDQRGDEQANLALGVSRATAVKAYLVAHGVPASRITIVSRGEESPVCSEHTEACWARNRRVRIFVGPA